jgi:hypothetical protein
MMTFNFWVEKFFKNHNGINEHMHCSKIKGQRNVLFLQDVIVRNIWHLRGQTHIDMNTVYCTVRDIIWNLHPGCNVDCYQQDGAGYGEITLNGRGQ